MCELVLIDPWFRVGEKVIHTQMKLLGKQWIIEGAPYVIEARFITPSEFARYEAIGVPVTIMHQDEMHTIHLEGPMAEFDGWHRGVFASHNE
jgi:hypothetical protein